MKIEKAVITAAGMGTRFLPVVKAYQKEMIPILEKPQIQYVIEEAIEYGINQIAVVSKEGVDTFKQYLEDNNKFWSHLKNIGKEDLMDSWIDMKKSCEIRVLYQKQSDPYGNGTPFVVAKEFIGNDVIAGMWGDDLLIKVDDSKPHYFEQLLEYYDKYSPVAIMQVIEVEPALIVKGGSFKYYTKEETDIPYKVEFLVEKPTVEEAPSFMLNGSRFILKPEVIDELSKNVKGKNNEVWLTDCVNRFAERKECVIAPPVEGYEWTQTGDPSSWLNANILIASKDERYRGNLIKNLNYFKSKGYF